MSSLMKVGIFLIVSGVILALGGGILGGFYPMLASIGFNAILPAAAMITLGIAGIIAGAYIIMAEYDKQR